MLSRRSTRLSLRSTSPPFAKKHPPPPEFKKLQKRANVSEDGGFINKIPRQFKCVTEHAQGKQQDDKENSKAPIKLMYDEEVEAPSEYEILRERNIQRRESLFRELNLEQVSNRKQKCRSFKEQILMPWPCNEL